MEIGNSLARSNVSFGMKVPKGLEKEALKYVYNGINNVPVENLFRENIISSVYDHRPIPSFYGDLHNFSHWIIRMGSINNAKTGRPLGAQAKKLEDAMQKFFERINPGDEFKSQYHNDLVKVVEDTSNPFGIKFTTIN